jgi:hypothetical protein
VLPTTDVPPLHVLSVRTLEDARSAVAALRSSQSGQTPAPVLLLAQSPPAEISEPRVIHGDNWLALNGPTEEIQELGNIRLAGLPDAEAAGFAAIRAVAMEGVHLGVVFGENVSERTLRSRAAENRVFVIQATSSGIVAYDPRGQRVGATSPRSPLGDETPAIELNTAQAADKEFAPRTNPFLARTPELYAF